MALLDADFNADLRGLRLARAFGANSETKFSRDRLFARFSRRERDIETPFVFAEFRVGFGQIRLRELDPSDGLEGQFRREFFVDVVAGTRLDDDSGLRGLAFAGANWCHRDGVRTTRNGHLRVRKASFKADNLGQQRGNRKAANSTFHRMSSDALVLVFQQRYDETTGLDMQMLREKMRAVRLSRRFW